MIQIIKQWRIILYFDLSEKSITFLINDNFYSNMLRKLMEIQFDIEPTTIQIKEVKQDQTTISNCSIISDQK